MWWTIPLILWTLYVIYCTLDLTFFGDLTGRYNDYWGHKNHRHPNKNKITVFGTVAIPVSSKKIEHFSK